MYLTLEQLARKLKRSTSFARACIFRFAIERVFFKKSKIFVYNISANKLKEIREYNETRPRHKKRNI